MCASSLCRDVLAQMETAMTVELPDEIRDFATQIRDQFGQGVKLLYVEDDTGRSIGKLPKWAEGVWRGQRDRTADEA